jgi:hypothetical protein
MVMAQHFAVTLRTASGCDGIRNLRALLKIAWRHFGLRAIDVREIEHPMHCRRSMQSDVQTKRRPEMTPMDMREFRKAKFLKVENCREPRQMRIAGAVLGKYSKPDLIFENGDRLGLSATNIEILSDTYGFESDQWAGHLVELYVGQGQFEGEMVDMVLVRPLSKAEGTEQSATTEPVKKAPKPPQQPNKSSGNSMDDEIQF